VLDKIGIAATNQRMEAWGLPNTKINAKVFRGSTTSIAPERTKRFGLGSTSAREMVALLEDLETGKHFRPATKQVILAHLKRCEDKEKFSRLLPAGTVLAHKTGSVSDIRTDAGILYLPDAAVALCVLTQGTRTGAGGRITPATCSVRAWRRKSTSISAVGPKVARPRTAINPSESTSHGTNH